MPAIFNKLHLKLKLNSETFIILILIIISIAAAVYFTHNDRHLTYYGDSLSRLNIARRTFDNLTPGLAQLGGIWLPVPQLILVPFVYNDYLWHTGLAGTIVSSFFFVLGGVYIFKTLRIINLPIGASFIGVLVYSTNLNLLYTQTTAMSELSFIALSIVLTFFLTKWLLHKNDVDIIISGFLISLLTLIRYEGLALLFASIILVTLTTFLHSKKYTKVEGKFLLFVTMAFFGFFIWMIYSAAIFGDAFYWKGIYVDVNADSTTTRTEISQTGIFRAIWWFFTSVSWMNGVLVTTVACIGFIFSIINSIKNKILLLFPIYMHLSLFTFEVLALLRKTPIEQPELSLASILSLATNDFIEFNIRYGMLMLPLISFMVAIFFNKNWFFKILTIGVLLLSTFNLYNPKLTLLYSIPHHAKASNESLTNSRDEHISKWMKLNYTDGLILVSAARHDPQLFKMGLPYSSFIHEGTGSYWINSLQEPQRYAKWIIMDYRNSEDVNDPVAEELADSSSLLIHYKLAYDIDGIRIFRIIDERNLTPVQNN